MAGGSSQWHTELQQGVHGEGTAGEEKAPTSPGFWPKLQEECQSDWAGLSPEFSKATDAPVMVEGWMVC